MATLFLQYPACSTCQKAKKWLTENNIEFTNRLIVEENPTVEELKAWIPRSGLPVKKFFNTSGLVYKELKLSEKLPAMSEEDTGVAQLVEHRSPKPGVGSSSLSSRAELNSCKQ